MATKTSKVVALKRKALREKGYLNTKELARELGISVTTIAQWKRRFDSFPSEYNMYSLPKVKNWLALRAEFTNDSRIVKVGENGKRIAPTKSIPSSQD